MEDDSEPTDADVLAQAIDYIEQYGWHKGTLFRSDVECDHHPACALGGVYAAASGLGWYQSHNSSTRESRLYTILANHPTVNGDMARYNDTPGRTWEEVKAVMLDVLSDLRLKEEANGN